MDLVDRIQLTIYLGQAYERDNAMKLANQIVERLTEIDEEADKQYIKSIRYVVVEKE